MLGACALILSGQAEVLDILTLGAKNDGSVDVSEIVNTNTEKGTLYFPAGIYKVSKPIYLKNPIRGAGYARVPKVDATRTWFISEIACTNGAVGVLNFGGKVRVNVENLNIKCASAECGIKIDNCLQQTTTFIDKVGIYNVTGTGLHVKGSGSRPIFAQNMSIFGAFDYPEPSEGITLDGPVDCRLSNIEIMGTRVGLNLRGGYTYGDNLHIWTGPLKGRDNGTWWKGTRGIILSGHAFFQGSEVYPDTCFYAIEQRSDNCSISLHNVMYWEDGSSRGAPDRNGKFFHAQPGVRGTLVMTGGLIGVGGHDQNEGWMRHVYSPGQQVRDVIIKSNYSICDKNLERLCLGGTLPDYTVDYREKGWCRVADIFTRAATGACRAVLVRDNGAVWQIDVVKDATGKVSFTTQPQNVLCEGYQIKTREVNGVLRVYLSNPQATPFSARWTTSFMGDYFRPLDHASLRGHNGKPRYHEVLELEAK